MQASFGVGVLISTSQYNDFFGGATIVDTRGNSKIEADRGGISQYGLRMHKSKETIGRNSQFVSL